MDANERERLTPSGSRLLLKEEVYAIVAAAIEVSNHLGCGFLEAVYQEALAIELAERGIPHVQQAHLAIEYKGRLLGKGYVADFICHDCIIVEIKASKALASVDEAQLLNYLSATRLPVGLLLNFGQPRLAWKRFANTRRSDAIQIDDTGSIPHSKQ